MSDYGRVLDVVRIDPVVKAVDPEASMPYGPVMLLYLAAIHREREQKVSMQVLDYGFHWLRVL